MLVAAELEAPAAAAVEGMVVPAAAAAAAAAPDRRTESLQGPGLSQRAPVARMGLRRMLAAVMEHPTLMKPLGQKW